jgi:hypothetical protein
MEYGIKFRPLKPASPHLNGKVERSQRADLEEFYPTVDLRYRSSATITNKTYGANADVCLFLFPTMFNCVMG